MRDALTGWWGGPLPERADFGERYPWRAVRAHALSRSYARRVDQARKVLAEAALIDGVAWAACISGGKDSTALALLLDLVGWRPPALSARDGFCWPGEERYLDALAERCGVAIRRVVVAADLRALAAETPGSLTADLEARGGSLSSHWYRALDADDRSSGITGKLWGIRADENERRRRARITKGRLYRRVDGMTICAPLSDWSALDVHAMLARSGVPPHPVYLCVDPGADALDIRHSWWVAGGGIARYGHYVWLRRWWPALWEVAVGLDPTVAELS